MDIKINSKTLGKTLHFWAHDASGYVRVSVDNGEMKQVFARSGAAEVARDEKALRSVARRYVAAHKPQ
jgi:hypothetical protein